MIWAWHTLEPSRGPSLVGQLPEFFPTWLCITGFPQPGLCLFTVQFWPGRGTPLVHKFVYWASSLVSKKAFLFVFFFPKSFIILTFIFRSNISYYLHVVWNVYQLFGCIHMNILLFKYHLWKNWLFIPGLYIFANNYLNWCGSIFHHSICSSDLCLSLW